MPASPSRRTNIPAPQSSPRHRKAPAAKRLLGIKTKIPTKWTLPKLSAQLRTDLKLKYTPDDWQLHVIQRLLLGYDVMAVAGTGYGKSLLFEGLASAGGKGKCVVMICPLKTLEIDQAQQAASKGLNTVYINEDTEKTPALWARVRQQAQLVYISPEMALSDTFIKIWTDAKFRKRLSAVIVDEAHCIHEWGEEDYRPDYRLLSELRGYTGYEIPFLACTATCQTETFDVIWDSLGFGHRPFWGIDVGVDRPNLYYATRVLENPSNPILDLLNLLPDTLSADTPASALPKSIIYLDSEDGCRDLVQAFRKVLPAELRSCVQAFSSVNSELSKAECWNGFTSGKYRIIVATDAAGMGCNVPDIANSVILGCPKSFSIVSQRWGRGGRDRTTLCTCLLLVPKWAFRPVIAPVLPAVERVRGGKKKVQEEPKENAQKRANLDPALEQFINITDDECAHHFMRERFRPDTGLPVRVSLTNDSITRSGRRGDISQLEMTCTVISLPSRQPPAVRCCHRCSPDILHQYTATDAHDPRLFKYAADFIYPLAQPPPSTPALQSSGPPAHVPRPSTPSGTFNIAPTSFKLQSHERDTLRDALVAWRERRHADRGGGDYMPSELGLPPVILDHLVTNAHRIFRFREVDRALIFSIVRWDTASVQDVEEVIGEISKWRASINVHSTPQSQRRSAKQARTVSADEVPTIRPLIFPKSPTRATGSTTRSQASPNDLFNSQPQSPRPSRIPRPREDVTRRSPQRPIPGSSTAPLSRTATASPSHSHRPAYTPATPSQMLTPGPTWRPISPAIAAMQTPTVSRTPAQPYRTVLPTPTTATRQPQTASRAPAPHIHTPPSTLSPYYRSHTYSKNPSRSYYR